LVPNTNPILLVAKRVEDQPEAVAVVQRRIAPRLGRDNCRRRPVVADDADVQRVFGEPDPYLRVLGRRLACVGGRLPEVSAGDDTSPGVVVNDDAVERWRHTEWRGGDDWPGSGGLLGDCGNGHANDEQDNDKTVTTHRDRDCTRGV
jgi:hypothetical protein